MKWGCLPHTACAKPTLLILGKTQRCHLGPLLSKTTRKETEGGQAAAFNSIQKAERYCLELRDEGFKPLVGSKSSQTGKYQQLRNGCEHFQRAREQIPPFRSRCDPTQTLGFSRSLAQPAADACSTLAHPWSRESLRSSQVGVTTALNWLSSPGSVVGLAGKLALHQAGQSCTRN